MSSLREGGAPLRSEAESVPQGWEALARYLARFDYGVWTALPQQFAGGFGNLN